LPDEFLLLIERAFEIKRLKEENIRLRKDLGKCYSAPNIIGESAGMRKHFPCQQSLSFDRQSSLVKGNRQELLPMTVHYQSSRKTDSL
jgi:two-component system response regulator PilR (NtrC family)